MAKLTRRGFMQGVGSIPLSIVVSGYSGQGKEEPSPSVKSAAIIAPRVEHRELRHYMAIRTQVTMQELGSVIPHGLRDVFAWLRDKGVQPAGPPFIRYLVIDMERQLDIELGVPVANALPGNDRIHAGTFPAGRYATAVYIGVRNGISANAALQRWGEKRGIHWQTRPTKKGIAWGARAEFFLTDPKQEPDPEKWQTEIVYLVAERRH